MSHEEKGGGNESEGCYTCRAEGEHRGRDGWIDGWRGGSLSPGGKPWSWTVCGPELQKHTPSLLDLERKTQLIEYCAASQISPPLYYVSTN